jgi:DMSO/TMAO reductase YedYZ heme-binding membrane subunit
MLIPDNNANKALGILVNRWRLSHITNDLRFRIIITLFSRLNLSLAKPIKRPFGIAGVIEVAIVVGIEDSRLRGSVPLFRIRLSV